MDIIKLVTALETTLESVKDIAVTESGLAFVFGVLAMFMLVNCLFGYKLIRLWCMLTSGIVGAALGIVVCYFLQTNIDSNIILYLNPVILIVDSIGFMYYGFKYYRLGIAMICAPTVFMLVDIIEMPFIVKLVIVALICTFIAIFDSTKLIPIIIISLDSGLLTSYFMFLACGVNNDIVIFITGLSLAILGFLCQWKLTHKDFKLDVMGLFKSFKSSNKSPTEQIEINSRSTRQVEHNDFDERPVRSRVTRTNRFEVYEEPKKESVRRPEYPPVESVDSFRNFIPDEIQEDVEEFTETVPKNNGIVSSAPAKLNTVDESQKDNSNENSYEDFLHQGTKLSEQSYYNINNDKEIYSVEDLENNSETGKSADKTSNKSADELGINRTKEVTSQSDNDSMFDDFEDADKKF